MELEYSDRNSRRSKIYIAVGIIVALVVAATVYVALQASGLAGEAAGLESDVDRGRHDERDDDPHRDVDLRPATVAVRILEFHERGCSLRGLGQFQGMSRGSRAAMSARSAGSA